MSTVAIFVGVDTHADTHHAATIDALGARLGDHGFPATTVGYRALRHWASSYGTIQAVGIEGTGSYGAGLARSMRAAGLRVLEVDRPDRASRRMNGKSDPLDAYAAATAVASGRAQGTPKARDGIVESIRGVHTARRSAIKARTQCMNQIHAELVSGPEDLREALRQFSGEVLIRHLARLRPSKELRDPATAARFTLRCLARRHQMLTAEITELTAALQELTTQAAPGLLARPGFGPDTTAQLLITAGDNPERLHSEAAFAHLCGASPIPASSGRTDRHRLNRGGDRQANRALYIVAIVRMAHDQRTRDYVIRRTAEGLSKKDIIRCLKRAIAREVYHELIHHNQHRCLVA